MLIVFHQATKLLSGPGSRSAGTISLPRRTARGIPLKPRCCRGRRDDPTLSPIAGFALIPENPSEAPHFTPILRWRRRRPPLGDGGCGLRYKFLVTHPASFFFATPVLLPEVNNRFAGSSGWRFASAALKSTIRAFSQPRAKTVTPRTLGMIGIGGQHVAHRHAVRVAPLRSRN